MEGPSVVTEIVGSSPVVVREIAGDVLDPVYQDSDTLLISIAHCTGAEVYGLLEGIEKKYNFCHLIGERKDNWLDHRKIAKSCDWERPGTIKVRFDRDEKTGRPTQDSPLIAYCFVNFFTGNPIEINKSQQHYYKNVCTMPKYAARGLLDTTEARGKALQDCLETLERAFGIAPSLGDVKRIIIPEGTGTRTSTHLWNCVFRQLFFEFGERLYRRMGVHCPKVYILKYGSVGGRIRKDNILLKRALSKEYLETIIKGEEKNRELLLGNIKREREVEEKRLEEEKKLEEEEEKRKREEEEEEKKKREEEEEGVFDSPLSLPPIFHYIRGIRQAEEEKRKREEEILCDTVIKVEREEKRRRRKQQEEEEEEDHVSVVTPPPTPIHPEVINISDDDEEEEEEEEEEGELSSTQEILPSSQKHML